MTETEANARSLVKYFLTNPLTEYIGEGLAFCADRKNEMEMEKSRVFLFLSSRSQFGHHPLRSWQRLLQRYWPREVEGDP